MLNTFIAHAVKYVEIAEDLKNQRKWLAEELAEIGWIPIQRRFDGSENFNRPWQDYMYGFGNRSGEFFVGLKEVHYRTQKRRHELFIRLANVSGNTRYAHYNDFRIGSEKEGYALRSLGKYSGTAGDALRAHENRKFTTFDVDNDHNLVRNCASNEYGGWWFGNCAYSSLNGKYYRDGICNTANGIHWGTWHGFNYTHSLTAVEMMIKPLSKSYKSNMNSIPFF
ncbi:fibrinogen-like protein 1 [Drosophila biarmipes]|uniref:fibrinogen-like protein 1 n=1 Tax=Drosophila biarmipes TaxID=125945 RepID=UPI0021CD091C|nr:fibrinogen-like protein 1 [Drosophila biarmipes]